VLARHPQVEYSEASKRVRLSVRDNGTGFPEHILKRAFEPYVTTKVKGTGLGLAVVKKIADEHGARIDISNRVQDGVSARGASVVIICSCGSYNTFSNTSISNPYGIATTGRQQWQTFWWSTTSWAYATCCQKFSTTKGIRSSSPKTRPRPAPPASASRPDLVLLDIWMPDTDGVTLLKEWSSSGLLTMPVIMMSGHATIDTAVEATKIGAMAFLEKPITLQKLLKAVEQGLSNTAPRKPSALNSNSALAPGRPHGGSRDDRRHVTGTH
jgi:CheY-like chemotaxis protein